MNRMTLFSGNANLSLAEDISKHLHLPLGKARVGRFSDGEIDIEILENVRGNDVYIIQPTCAPCSENLMELLTMADALRRASAERITAVVPYFGFARQDRRIRSIRVPITAKVVADMIATVGIDRILTVELHAEQIQGFFDIPVDNIYATPIILDDIRKKELDNLMVISPDVGGVMRARAIAKRLPGTDMAIIDKRRSKPNEAEAMHVIGDVSGQDCVIIDDIVDTAGTLCVAVKTLKEKGATSVTAYIVHPVLSGKAVETIENSVLDEIVVTNTIPLSETAKQCKKIRQIDSSALLAKAIRRISESRSLSSIFVQ